MPRWEPDAADRLQAAAFELFDEQGFERTTVAEIAQRAGLTQRTFFNHFADKREVLFGLGSEFQQEIVREIAACADTLPPLDAVVRALQAAADTIFEERRAAVTRRHAIIDANPELHERELSKRAALTDAIAAALHARGLDTETALLTASAGMLVQQTAIQRWTQPAESRPLRELLSDALHSLRTMVSQRSGRRVASPGPDRSDYRPQHVGLHCPIGD
jgi:AcrR family transcriptional regulator